MKPDKKFTKYLFKGDYHRQQLAVDLFNFNAYLALRYQKIIDLIPQNKPLKLLDVGCGEGVLLSLIKKTTKAQVYGIDPQADQLIFPPDLKIKSASAYQLPFENNFFDYIISAEVIEHLTKPDRMLTEVVRVLKPQGTAIITTPIKLTTVPSDKMHVKEYTPLELKNFLKPYFNQVTIKTSHSAWQKKLYLKTLFRIGRFHFDLFRWLINACVLVFNFNPFALPTKQPSQQLAVLKQPKK